MSKGISPLIATVILIAFTVAIASIASTFFVGFTREQTAGAQQRGSETIDCGNAAIRIVDVTNNTNDILVTVEKLGSYDFTDVDFTVRNTSTNVSNSYALDLRINDTNSVTVANLSKANPGGAFVYEITATTECAGIRSTVRNQSGGYEEVF